MLIAEQINHYNLKQAIGDVNAKKRLLICYASSKKFELKSF